MDWRLRESAKEAEDTAANLHVFLNEIPEYAKEITGEIAELYAISHALHTVHEGLERSQYGIYVGRISRDLDIVLPSLRYTLEDVRNMFNKSKKQSKQHPGAFPGTPDYTIIWEDALEELEDEGVPLPRRLELYRLYLQSMFDVLKGYVV